MFDELLNAGQRAGEWAGQDGNGQLLALLGANLMQGGARGMSTTQGLGQALQMGIMANAQQEAFRRQQAAQAVKAQQDAESHQAQLALSGARTRSAETNTQRDLQGMESEKKQEPLKIQKLEAEVKGAKTKADVDAIRLRLLEVEASPEGMKNSQRLQQLKLDLAQKQVDSEAAQARAHDAMAGERTARANLTKKETDILEKTGMKPGTSGAGGQKNFDFQKIVEANPGKTPEEHSQLYLEWKKQAPSKPADERRMAHLSKLQAAGYEAEDIAEAMAVYDASAGGSAPAAAPVSTAEKPAEKKAKIFTSAMLNRLLEENAKSGMTREEAIKKAKLAGWDVSGVAGTASKGAYGKIGETK